MKRRFLFLVSIGLLCVFVIIGARHLQARRAMGRIVPVSQGLISANTGFAFKLFKNLALQNSQQNIVVSPASVSMTLAMAYNGARGKTQKEMAETLGFNSMSLADVNKSYSDLMENLNNPGTGVVLETANGLWAAKQYPLASNFLSACKEYYDAEVDNVYFADPSAKSRINKWINRKTHNRIPEIAEGLDKSTVLCLINAIYFKGVWTWQFDKARTEEDIFILAGHKLERVPTMHQEGKFRYYEGDGFNAVALPYGSKRMSMYIFVPLTENGLPELLKSLNADNWSKWMSGFHETKVKVILPRWKLECEMDLKKPCSDLGMENVFHSGSCDFSGMCKSGAKDVFISVLKQKAFIEVNEEGTEAAAATIVVMARSGCPEIRANRPFFYAIQDDQTNTILFMGTVVNPMQGESSL